MSERPTRFTRSMTNTSVNDHSSKEFSFCDPEFFFRDSPANPKSRTKTNPKEKIGIGNEEKNPFAIPNRSPNVIKGAPENGKIFLGLFDGIVPFYRNLTEKSGGKNLEVQEKTYGSLEGQVPCDEKDDMSSDADLTAIPRMGKKNDENFEKSENMENSIFSPNNSAGSRNLGKATKNGLKYSDDQPVTKTQKRFLV